MPEDGKPRICALPAGRYGTVPVGGVMILVISIENRDCGFRLTIKTDEVEIVIDIP